MAIVATAIVTMAIGAAISGRHGRRLGHRNRMVKVSFLELSVVVARSSCAVCLNCVRLSRVLVLGVRRIAIK